VRETQRLATEKCRWADTVTVTEIGSRIITTANRPRASTPDRGRADERAWAMTVTVDRDRRPSTVDRRPSTVTDASPPAPGIDTLERGASRGALLTYVAP
jgi:hypothetical protein